MYAPSCGVYISQLVRFARVCSDVSDFNERSLYLSKIISIKDTGIRNYLKLCSNFYYHYTDLVRKFDCKCRHLIRRGISHPIVYGNIFVKVWVKYPFKEKN